jgi:uncharacterized protein
MATGRIEGAKALFEAINKGDWDYVIDRFAEEGSLFFPGSSPLSGLHEGKEKVRKYFRRMHIAVPDLTFRVSHMAETEDLIFIEWKNCGKTRKGVPYENCGVTVLEFTGDKIRQLRDYLDTEKLGGSPGNQV